MYRIGIGYDAHRFVEGRKLILAGVEIPYEKGLEGWSDADVLSHAIADAILGAASAGDIGKHFPPGDPLWKDAPSLDLIAAAVNLVANMGFEVANVDTVLIMEAPKIAEYGEKMAENIASAMAVETLQVSVKATTTEGMGFAGTGEGAAAQAVALLRQVGA